MTKMITQNKKMLPTTANWRKKDDGTWIHKDAPRKLSGKKLETYKKTLTLTQQQKDILIGCLLGDASIRQTGSSTYNVRFAQQKLAADYVEHLYQIFKPFVGTPPKICKIGGIAEGKPLRYDVRFTTYRHDCFKQYYDLFYPKIKDGNKRIKRIPKNIGQLLTVSSLAYWFMDDGTRGATIDKAAAYCISTHSFSYEDQLILVKALEKRFGIQSVLYKDKTYFKLSIKKESRSAFRELIEPFIHPYFGYKL